MKGLDTFFDGYNFRSRLEARWAAYFKYVGIRYSYEALGVEIEKGSKYLPDFYLPDQKAWVEVKFEALKPFSYEQAKDLVIESNTPLIILDGDPTCTAYEQIKPDGDGGVYIEQINLIPQDDKSFLSPSYLDGEEVYEMKGYQHIIDAVYKTRSLRFGVHEMKTNKAVDKLFENVS